MRARQKIQVWYKPPAELTGAFGGVSDDWSAGQMKTAFAVLSPVLGQALISAYGENAVKTVTLNLPIDCEIALGDGVWLDTAHELPFGKVVSPPRKYLRHVEADVRSL
ncbi:MAG: hypothetical protein PHI27_08770 [Eubacteriales bacterium]|nr:hypothetical protein [Eubacteriales bacterium]MDD3882332.1 hypothetical protein [Eubacteriales bacterium]MDD4512078.1 hypothetical protein [Eubacteriales bacterium]